VIQSDASLLPVHLPRILPLAADGDLAANLRGLVTRLVRDAAEHVADQGLGEVAAIVQRSHEVLTALSAEAQDADDRQCRYRSRAAVLNLLVRPLPRGQTEARGRRRASRPRGRRARRLGRGVKSGACPLEAPRRMFLPLPEPLSGDREIKEVEFELRLHV